MSLAQKRVLVFLCPPQKQLPGNSAIVQNLLVQFDAKLVAGCILS